jgi:fluoroquinolone transport system permease protein
MMKKNPVLQRMYTLLKGDMLFQRRYGFYWLYLFFVIFYASLLSIFPQTIQSKAAGLLVFTDPAAMGLFFMGAIVLFEKSQRVIESLSVSPVKTGEYILSKAVSILIISLVSALAIALSVYADTAAFFSDFVHIALFCTAIILSSLMFTFAALGCASLSKSLNQFMIFTIPFEVLLMVPPVLYIFGFGPPWLEYNPGTLALRLILNDNLFNPVISILMLSIWVFLSFLFAYKSVNKMMVSWGGIKL